MNQPSWLRKIELFLITIALFIGFISTLSFAGTWNGWIYQNPYPTKNTLLAVKFITPKKGWMAGQYGTILHTEDGGETWEAQESGTEQDIKSLFFINQNMGWMVGNGGLIIHTEDGGKRWVKQGSPEEPLHIVFFINERNGWAGGSTGTLLHTSDGGKNWKKLDIGTGADIAGIYFLNPNMGWILTEGKIYRTSNGGKDWQASNLPAVKMPRRGRRAQSSETISMEPTDHKWEGSVHFLNEKKGWATVGLWHIFSTEDGGKTWQSTQVSHSVDRIAFIDEKNGCMVGASILCTDDGGKTWHERLAIKSGGDERVQGYFVSIWGLTFVNQSIGWAVGKDGQIWKTEDGGKSWKVKSGYRPFVYLWDSKTAWGIVRDQKTKKPSIAKTEDGGNTWQIQKILDNPETHDNRTSVKFFFVNPNTGWAVGEEEGRDKYKGPLILNYFILGTNDGGKTWVTQFKESGGELGNSNDFQDVYFINSDIGWAVGRNGLILHTKNGGKHWERQKSGTKSELWSVQFINSKKGWVLGNKVYEGSGTPIVLHTDNGGERWHIQWKREADWSWLMALSFTDEKNGRFLGEIHEFSGDLLFVRTTDGGKTWSEKELPEIFPDKMFFLDANRGVILTEKGQMLITRDGGKTWDKRLKPIRVNPWHVSEIFKER